jgi:iron complex outermembrane receptor protein
MPLTSIKAPLGTLALGATLWSVVAPASYAQQAPQTSVAAADAPNQPGSAASAAGSSAQNGAAGSGALQEVVVTAERRAVNIQQTPIAITAIQGEQLQSLHLTTTTDLQTTVPGFQAQDSGGQYVRYNIRGLGVPANNPAIQIGVKAILDGVVQDLNTGQDQPMYDMADVEVLEGPQGTFVGSSAIGGAVELNTANPNFNGFNGYVLAGAGSYLDVKLQGAVNLPVSDTFAMRLAFNFEQRNSFSNDIGDTLGGFYYQSYSAVAPQTDGPPRGLIQGSAGSGAQIDPGNVDSRQIRVKALWKPTDNVQSLTAFYFSTNNTDGTPSEPNPATYQNLFAYPNGCSTVAGTTFTGTQLVCPGVVRCLAVFDPIHQRGQFVPFIGAWASSTVAHTRSHE